MTVLFCSTSPPVPVSARERQLPVVQPPSSLSGGIGRSAAKRAARAEQYQLYRARLVSGRITPREREVMALVVTGMANKRTVDKLGISEKSTRIHRVRFMDKMQIRSLAELVCLGTQLAANRLGHKPAVAHGRGAEEKEGQRSNFPWEELQWCAPTEAGSRPCTHTLG
ncbi:LuxR C-terminal-related transcriptional regulator [Paraburkholderia sp. CNPSo 3281]|uniref:LuxR C-terminal-related transcriptional regulator n=1 Tax=Paraburkholderia sp. CNPSo 3281 TaxID=2940933 RepID=UPI0035CCCA67